MVGKVVYSVVYIIKRNLIIIIDQKQYTTRLICKYKVTKKVYVRINKLIIQG